MLTALLSFAVLVISVNGQCNPTITKAGGPQAPSQICAGQLIFEDTFDSLNTAKWKHDRTLAGGGNWEFQWYDNDPLNSYVENGVLYLRPSFTSDFLGGEDKLYSATIKIPPNQCTQPDFFGCERTGTPDRILNPIRSAALRTIESFWFTYGKVEFRARIPAGDWLWPALWMLPKDNVYGPWPYSGEIDVMESRGNRNYTLDGEQIGTQQVGQTIHFPFSYIAHFTNNPAGYDNDFHTYGVEWSPQGMRYFVDGQATTFTAYGKPFDEHFYLIMNLAVGGTLGYFPEGGVNEIPRAWGNNEGGMTDFWKYRQNTWLPTWNLGVNNDKEASFHIDYVRVWAL